MSEIIQDIQNGKMVILVDDEDRENEGDIVLAAEFVTPEHINFMAKHARGLICLTLTPERCQQLDIGLMVHRGDNGTQYGTNFTVSIEAAQGVTTGISAHDRARTIQVAIQPQARPQDIVQPGHVFPLMAQKGGVLMRAGHTEAGCDLAMLANLSPYAVICEIMNDDGSMARLTDLEKFAAQYQLKIGSIADLIQYRLHTQRMIQHLQTTTHASSMGDIKIHVYQDIVGQQIHLAVVRGVPDNGVHHVRVHEPLSVVDFLCNDSMHSWALTRILQRPEPDFTLVLLNCVQTSDQLLHSLDKLAQLQNHGAKPVLKTDIRTYGIGAQILQDLGVQKMRLFTQPRKLPSLAAYGLEVVDYVVD